MRALTVPFLLLLTSAALAAPEAIGPATRDYDQIHLDVALRLDMEAGAVTGRARHRIASLVDGLTVVRMHLEDMVVVGVRADDGLACAFQHDGGVLAITLDRPREAGEEFGVEIEYAGRPRSGLWFFGPTESHPGIPLQVWSQGEGTENRHWIPCYDLPDDRLTTTLRLDVPAGLDTLSNGTRESVTETTAGRSVHVWSLEREHPSYLITLVAGRFDEVVSDAAGVPHHVYVPPGAAPLVPEVFGRTPSMMAFFAEFTGEPYPWPRYSQVTVWDFMWGGMENTGATTLNMRALHREGVRPDYSADGLIAHELAHQWFGDLITCRTFDHMWLNEGFATYFTDLWLEHHEGSDAFAVARMRSLESYMDAVDLAALAGKAAPPDPGDCGDVRAHPYVKGSSVLHMLRGVLGDDVFREGIRRYVRDARDRSVDTAVLRAAFEAVSKRDLRPFFAQWVHGSGFPRLAVSATTSEDDGGALVTLRVRQTQPATPEMPHFTTPVDVDVTWSDGTVARRRFVLSGAAAEWQIRGPAGAARWRIDPDGWLLARLEIQRSRDEWADVLATDEFVPGRIRAARALGGMGVEAVPALAKALTEDAQHEVRAEVALALGKVGGRSAARALVAASTDGDSRVRARVFEALGDLPGAWSAETLRQGLTDASDYAAAAAAAALGKTRDSAAFAALVTGLDRESHRDVVRREIMVGLAALGDPRGAAIARPFTAYTWGKGIQHRLRHAALDAAVDLAPSAPGTRALIVSLLADPYFRMRIWAAEHAAQLGIAEAVPALEAALDTATAAAGPGVKSAFERALARLR